MSEENSTECHDDHNFNLSTLFFARKNPVVAVYYVDPEYYFLPGSQSVFKPNVSESIVDYLQRALKSVDSSIQIICEAIQGKPSKPGSSTIQVTVSAAEASHLKTIEPVIAELDTEGIANTIKIRREIAVGFEQEFETNNPMKGSYGRLFIPGRPTDETQLAVLGADLG